MSTLTEWRSSKGVASKGEPYRGAAGRKQPQVRRFSRRRRARTAENWISNDSWLPEYTANAKEGRVGPGVYCLKDELGNTVVRTVDTGDIPDYDAILTSRLFRKDNATLILQCRNAKRLFVVIDPAVHEIYGDRISAYFKHSPKPFFIHKLPKLLNNEENKSTPVFEELNEWLMDHRINPKKDMLIGIGGGVVSDLIGLAAATTRRGKIPYLRVTTTLTATIDAAISPKTAINMGRHKNSCGDTYPPKCVLSDTSFLATDPSIQTGLAELTKLSIVRSANLFGLLEREGPQLLAGRFQCATGRSLIELGRRLFLKMKFEPPFPGNEPASLRSFGHSFSRNLESRSGFMLTHGEAIGVEMAVAANLASDMGVLPAPEKERIVSLLANLQLVPYCPECTADEIWPVFEDKAEADEPFWFPIPQGNIGRGGFLRRFSKSQLASAVSKVALIRTRQAITGRVKYLAKTKQSPTPMLVTADFLGDGTDRFLEDEPGIVRSFVCEQISQEERTFAYRLLLRGGQSTPLASYER